MWTVTVPDKFKSWFLELSEFSFIYFQTPAGWIHRCRTQGFRSTSVNGTGHPMFIDLKTQNWYQIDLQFLYNSYQKNPTSSFAEIDKLILKFMWKLKGSKLPNKQKWPRTFIFSSLDIFSFHSVNIFIVVALKSWSARPTSGPTWSCFLYWLLLFLSMGHTFLPLCTSSNIWLETRPYIIYIIICSDLEFCCVHLQIFISFILFGNSLA